MSAGKHEADVLFDVAMGLKKARARSLRGGGRLADMTECQAMARAILDHLWLTGQEVRHRPDWKPIEPGPATHQPVRSPGPSS